MIDRFNTTLTSKVYQTINNSNLYNLAIMTTINSNSYDFKDNKSGKKYQTPKPGRSAKLRRTDDYWLDKNNKERRKQTKVRYTTTHRRDEQPDPEDERLEEIHYANFLGCGKLAKDGRMTYNNEETINICLADIFIREETDDTSEASEAIEDIEASEASVLNVQSYQGTVFQRDGDEDFFDWYYDPVKKSLRGVLKSQYRNDSENDSENDSQPDSETQSYHGINDEEYLDAMVNYMKRQIDLAVLMSTDEPYVCDCDQQPSKRPKLT